MTEIPDSPARLLVDFRRAAELQNWRTVLDGVMGGRSTGDCRLANGAMIFEGELHTHGGGFSSVRRDTSDFALGTTEEVGIRIRVRGDGRSYSLRLRQPVESRDITASYGADFTAPSGERWHDVYLPYSSLMPTWRGRKLDLPSVALSHVDEIGIMIADGLDGPFRVEVAEIATYVSCASEGHRADCSC